MLSFLCSMSFLFLLCPFFEYGFIMISFLFFLSSSFIYVVNSPLTFSGLFFLDELGGPLIILTFWVGALMIMATESSKSSNNSTSYIGWILLLLLVLSLVFCASNFLSFYIFFEGSLIPVSIMILGWGYQPERLQAGFYLMVYTVSASLPLLLVGYSMILKTGHFSFFLSLWEFPFFFNLSVWWIFCILAFMVKTPLYFVHLWLPKAHVEAPVAGSMVLAGVLLKLGGFGMFRMMVSFQLGNSSVCSFFSSVSLWGGFLCGLICLRQTDMKGLIAYSSVTHMGVMVGGVMGSSVVGWQGSLLMMLSHGLVSSGMFMGVNMMYKVFSSRSIFFVRGLLSVAPVFSLMWFMLMTANMGVPPSLNLQSELMLAPSILYSSIWFVVPLSLSLFFSACYSLLIYSSTQYGSLGEFSFFFSLFSIRSVLGVIMHVVPTFFLFLSSGLFLCWVV